MKKIFYSAIATFLSLLFFSFASAQGIYQIWGTTSFGGTDESGTIFRTDGEGKNLKSMYSFTRTNMGANPMYNQLTAYNGKFYSMASSGGANYLGVIFEWDPLTNIYTKKFDFETATGNDPFGSLALLNGKFYGMTQFGGANDMGVIFEWDPATNVYTKKFDLNDTNGANPYGSLLLNGGKFYGMTRLGGANNMGVIFEWDPATNTFSKKHDFDGLNGSNPNGDLVVYNGKFYGMTSSGGGGNGRGVIFEWDVASGNYTVKYEFSSVLRQGDTPYGNLVISNDKFYGMTSKGGVSGDAGVIFEWDPATNTYLKRLDIGDNSENPFGNLLLKDGKFYGMVYNRGGGKFSRGFLFEWNPVTNNYARKYIYENNAISDESYTGANPRGSLVVGGDKIYGMTSSGGSSENGVIFEYDPSGAGTYTRKINFNHPGNGASPNSLVYQEGNLFGITASGGKDGTGVIFEWDYAANRFTKHHELNPDPTNSRNPLGNLVYCNGKFYAMSFYASAGPTFHQAIFEWDAPTNTYVQKATFQIGAQPTGNLVSTGGKIYGMYKSGGIFEWDPVTNLFTNLYTLNFSGIDGTNPQGGLVESNGKLYGMTSSGGVHNEGVIFEWNLLTKTFLKRHDFDSTNGAKPFGNLAFYEGVFYGVTSAGGSNNLGIIFEWDHIDNVFTKKYDFARVTGSKPFGTLVLNNGKLYGMTSNGGVNNAGVIFEWDPATNVYSKSSEFTGLDGRNPNGKNGLTLVPALAARGIANNCVTYSPVVANNTENNWVPIFDDNGFAIAEIKANGNNLGVITTSLFVNSNPLREDGARRLYLDRNITITPQFQPTTPVDIRLYIRGEEFNTIKNGNNSAGSASGINSISDLGIFKNDDECGSNLIGGASAVVTTGAKWESDYVLSATIGKFSTFYFASKASAVLPLTLLEFSGRLQNNDALLNWKTENELNTLEFIVERSLDGSSYKAIGKVAAASRPGIHDYRFTDPAINNTGAKTVWYRLKQYDVDGQFVYSKTVTLSPANENTIVRIYPNPVNNILNLSIYTAEQDHIKWQITDATGKIIYQQSKQITAGNNNMSIDVTSIATGVYYLSIKGNTINKWIQFVKQ